MTLTIDKGANCDLYNSCKKTRYASQVSAMSNAIGFTTFQGAEAYVRIPVFIFMNYTDEKTALNLDFDRCDLKVPEDNILHGFNITKDCGCNSCAEQCRYDLAAKSSSVFLGFNGLTVLIVYAIVFIGTISLFILKKFFGNKDIEESDED